MKENKKYPASRLRSLLGILLLTGIVTVLTNIIYQPYYKYTINGEFVGYYKSYEDYKKTYESIEKIKYVNGAKMDRYIISRPIGEFMMVKQSYVEKFNNYQLIENQMIEDYTIYKVIINEKENFYTATEEEANKMVTEIKEKVKESTIIKIEPIIVKDLSLIETEENLIEKRNKIIEENKKVTSRSGIARATKKSNYIWPTVSKTITSKFGNRASGYHTGLDIGVPTNSPIYAMMSGKVILSSWNGNYGYQVKIQHYNGVITAYAHNNKLLVSKGQEVVQGQQIALSGSTGNSTGPHTHIEFIINGKFENPLNYIR